MYSSSTYTCFGEVLRVYWQIKSKVMTIGEHIRLRVSLQQVVNLRVVTSSGFWTVRMVGADGGLVFERQY